MKKFSYLFIVVFAAIYWSCEIREHSLVSTRWFYTTDGNITVEAITPSGHYRKVTIYNKNWEPKNTSVYWYGQLHYYTEYDPAGDPLYTQVAGGGKHFYGEPIQN